MHCTVHGTLQARILDWVAFPFSRGSSLPNPGFKPRSPALQADSLPAEPQGEPKNTGVGSLSLLQQIFRTQESNRSLLYCKRIIYRLSYQGSPNDTSSSHTRSWTWASRVALEEDLKILDFAYWLNYYYLVTLDCFPFLLHVLTSLIKLTCWQKFFPQKASRGHGRQGPWGPAPFQDLKSTLCYSENSVDYKVLIRVKRDAKLSGHLGSLWEDSRQMLSELKPQIAGSVVWWILQLLYGVTQVELVYGGQGWLSQPSSTRKKHLFLKLSQWKDCDAWRWLPYTVLHSSALLLDLLENS